MILHHSESEYRRLRKTVQSNEEVALAVLRLAYLLSWNDRYLGNQDIEDFYRDLDELVKTV